jgi:hypothetical protein
VCGSEGKGIAGKLYNKILCVMSVDRFDVKSVSVNSPEIFSYEKEFTQIDADDELPIVFVNQEKAVSGISDADAIWEQISKLVVP